MIGRQVGVDHGRLNIRMAQQLSDYRQVDSLHDQVAGKSVAQCMQLGQVLDTGQHRIFMYSSFPFSLFVFPFGYAAPFSGFPSSLYLFFPYHPCLFLRVFEIDLFRPVTSKTLLRL